MDSRVIEAPTADEVDQLLGESKRRNACFSLYTRCAVAYEGRAQSQLESGDRFVLCKPDGTVLVHGDTKQEPRNWQPPGATVQVTDTDPLVLTAVRTNPREVIRITCDRVYYAALLPMDDDASLELQGSEADLRERIFATPELIEALEAVLDQQSNDQSDSESSVDVSQVGDREAAISVRQRMQ